MSDAVEEFHYFRESRPGLRPTWVAVLDGKRIVAGAGSAAEAGKLARDWRAFFPTRPNDWDDYVDHGAPVEEQCGYVCKRCGGPSPIGVGYVDETEGAAERSAGVTVCGCGWSAAACSQCGPGHDRGDGFCERHGKLIIRA